ncbi:hypothetical protein BH20CHL6_BH20CHL6_10660 [soil metagenome]
MPTESFADWLRLALRARGISQRHLAALSGVNHSTISRLLAGDRTPSLATAGKLLRVLRAIPAGGSMSGIAGGVRSESVTSMRIRLALEADESLDEADVEAVLRFHRRVRRMGAPRRRMALERQTGERPRRRTS